MVKIFKALIINSAYLYLIQGLNYLLPLIVLPYLINTLSKSSFGIFAYSQSFIQILLLFVDFGFNLSATKKITSLPVNSPLVIEIYWRITIIKIFLATLLAGLSYILFSWGILIEYKTGVFFALVALLGNALFPVWLFQGLNQVRLMSLISIISKISTFPFIFVFVKTSIDYLPAIQIYATSSLIAGLISIFIILRSGKYRLITASFLKFHQIHTEIKSAWPIFLSNSAITVFTSSLTVLLGFFGTSDQVGVFGAIERIVRAATSGIFGPISQAAFPIIAKLKQKSLTAAIRLFRILLILVMTLMCVLVGVFYLFNSLIIRLFFEGQRDIFLINLAILTILPIAAGAVCGQLGLLGLGDEQHKRIFSKVYIYAGILFLPLIFFLVKYYLLPGAVASMMISEIIIGISMLILVRKYKYL